MSKEIKGDHKHLTLSDRIYIEQALNRGDNFRTIAGSITKDPSTISLEVRRFIEWQDGYYARTVKNDCAHYNMKFGFSGDLIDYLMSAIEKYGILIDSSPSGITLPDMKDVPFYEVVLEKRDDNAYLVTGCYCSVTSQ